MAAILGLTRSDLRNVTRDSFLMFLIIYPFLLGPMMRWLAPFAAEGMAEIHDLTQYYPLLTALFGLLMAPTLLGTAIGFVLLDERDARTLLALQVTPLPATGYLAYRLLLPVIVSVASAYTILPVMNLTAVSPGMATPMILMGALCGPIFTLIMAGYAGNKVQGLAMMKAMGFLMIAPTAAWFVPEPWQFLLGVLPTYWPAKALWVALDGGAVFPFVLAGLAVTSVYLAALVARFRYVMANLSA